MTTPRNPLKWRDLTETIEILEDKYSWRYVERLAHRCTVWQFYLGTATFSETRCHWYRDYASPDDAIKAAKRSVAERGELERSVLLESYQLADGLWIEPSPQVERPGW